MIGIVRQVVLEFPTLLVCLACIIVAVIYWRQAPLSSLCVITACSLTAVVLIFWAVLYDLFLYVFSGVPGVASTGDTLFQIFWSVVRGVAMGLTVFAVYAGRKRNRG
jgi:hypothetical protein